MSKSKEQTNSGQRAFNLKSEEETPATLQAPHLRRARTRGLRSSWGAPQEVSTLPEGAQQRETWSGSGDLWEFWEEASLSHAFGPGVPFVSPEHLDAFARQQ